MGVGQLSASSLSRLHVYDNHWHELEDFQIKMSAGPLVSRWQGEVLTLHRVGFQYAFSGSLVFHIPEQ